MSVVVEGDWSYPVVTSSWHHIVIVCPNISLITPVPIAQDPVEPITITILSAVLKASEVVRLSTCKNFIDRSWWWELKPYSASKVTTHYLCYPDSRFAICNSDPHCYSLIKALVHLLQLVHLSWVAETLCNVNKCLRLANSLAKVKLVDVRFQSGLNPFFSCAFSALYIRQHFLRVANLDAQLAVRLGDCSCGMSQNSEWLTQPSPEAAITGTVFV